MIYKEIKVLSWKTTRELLVKENNSLNIEFLNILTEISEILESESNDYVYYLKLGYGDVIIDKGKTFLNRSKLFNEKENIQIIGGTYGKAKKDFENDVLYSDDPLGIVLTNQIEVFTDNRSLGSNNSGTYTVPLNIIRSGEMFGVFGLLDYISGINMNDSTRDWYARAGIISYSIAFPFHNAFETDLLSHGSKFSHLSGKEFKEEKTAGDNKVEFIKTYLDDWNIEIAYIPKHYFNSDKVPAELKLKAINILYKIGWEQSLSLRNSMFEDTTIINLISKQRKGRFKHEKNFLSILYQYLSNAYSGNALVMRPLVDKKNVIVKAISHFEEENQAYFNNINRCKKPLPFIFSRIKSDNDWGLVSIYHLPIIYNYEIQSLNVLLNDIGIINQLIEGSYKINNDYKIVPLIGFGNTGNRSTRVKVNKRKPLYKLVAKSFQEKVNKVSLNSKEFSNLLLIKNGS